MRNLAMGNILGCKGKKDKALPLFGNKLYTLKYSLTDLLPLDREKESPYSHVTAASLHNSTALNQKPFAQSQAYCRMRESCARHIVTLKILIRSFKYLLFNITDNFRLRFESRFPMFSTNKFLTPQPFVSVFSTNFTWAIFYSNCHFLVLSTFSF